MATPPGLILALDLVRAPVLAEAMRRQPLLPSHDILVLLRIAGGCPDTIADATRRTGESVEVVRQAVVLYLEQVLLFPEADSYRVLGVSADAPQSTIREHLHWMMRWLHPDRNRNSWETVFAGRVLSAWEDLKSPLRRTEYDRRHGTSEPRGVRPGTANLRKVRMPWIAAPLPRRRGFRTWLEIFALGFFVGMIAWLAWTEDLQLWFATEAPEIRGSDLSSGPPEREMP